jgi:DNA-binding LacI/PurR family transcriptional regulator
MESKSVSIAEIAKNLGVHKSTVSRALREDPRIPPATRVKVRQAANRLGYVFDPVSSSLAQYRRKKNKSILLRQLAWIDNWPTEKGYLQHLHAAEYYNSAVAHAKKRGFELKPFWLRQPDTTPQKAAEMLVSQGVRGLIFAPQSRPHATVRFPWNQFSVVSIGYSMVRPRLHVVAKHQYHDISMGLAELNNLGYRRVGLATHYEHTQRTDRNHWAGFLVNQHFSAKGDRVPVFSPKLKEDFNSQNFLTWFNKYGPEVVISHDRRVYEWLQESGRKIPKDVGFMCLTVPAGNKTFSGIDHQPHIVGESAVDFLISMLQRNELGIPAFPLCLISKSKWIKGKTLRRVKASRV